jgi:hypothetical protein
MLQVFDLYNSHKMTNEQVSSLLRDLDWKPYVASINQSINQSTIIADQVAARLTRFAYMRFDSAETAQDWNCSISLWGSPGEKNMHDNTPARLPRGIDCIRDHIKNVDNVPLLVPLFFDV